MLAGKLGLPKNLEFLADLLVAAVWELLYFPVKW